MKKEEKTVVYDEELRHETYRFEGSYLRLFHEMVLKGTDNQLPLCHQ